MFNAEEDEGNFKASKGWLEHFLKRHSFRLRVPTTVCQKPKAEYAQKLVDFVMFVSRLRQQKTYDQSFAADETAVWLDPSGGKCVDELGAKDVSVVSTGHDKLRVTVMLTARSDGKKSLPFELLPRKRPDPRIVEKFKNKLVLRWAGKVWMDDKLTSNYLQHIFGRSLFGKRLLVWDSFRCHIRESTKKELKAVNSHTAVIPGGCTKFIQAPDVVWNGLIKAKLQQLYNTWMLKQ